MVKMFVLKLPRRFGFEPENIILDETELPKEPQDFLLTHEQVIIGDVPWKASPEVWIPPGTIIKRW